MPPRQRQLVACWCNVCDGQEVRREKAKRHMDKPGATPTSDCYCSRHPEGIKCSESTRKRYIKADIQARITVRNRLASLAGITTENAASTISTPEPMDLDIQQDEGPGALADEEFGTETLQIDSESDADRQLRAN